MFKDNKLQFKIIEIEKSTRLPEITGDLRESLKTLQFQPAFQYLLQRFRFQRAAMESALREGINLTEIQLRYLQAGIFWASQMERDIMLLTQSSSTQTRTPAVNEAEEFQKVHANMELISA